MTPDIRERAERLADDLVDCMDGDFTFNHTGAADLLSQALLEAHNAGRAEMREKAAGACKKQAEVFGSSEYATGQPLSSFAERFACGQCETAIRSIK